MQLEKEAAIEHLANPAALKNPGIANSLLRLVRGLGVPPEELRGVTGAIQRAARAQR